MISEMQKLSIALGMISYWWLHEEEATKETFPANSLQSAFEATRALDAIAYSRRLSQSYELTQELKEKS